MKKALYFISAALLLVAGSCAKQLDSTELDIPAGGRVSALTADMPATKAVFENDQVMKWQEGDQIGVYVYSTTLDNATEYTPWIAPYTLASGAGETKATFTHVFSDESLGETFGNVAIYPYADGSVYHYSDAGSTLDLMLPIEYYVSTLEELQRVNMPMVAVLDMTDDSSKESISFQHVGGAIKVTINGLDPKKVAWVELLAEGKRVNGLFTGINVSGEQAPVVEAVPVDGDPQQDFNYYNNQRRVIISFPEDIDMPDPAVFYFPVPAGTYNSFSILGYDRNRSLYFSKYAQSDANIVNRGTILQMPAFDAPQPIVAQSWTVVSSLDGWADDTAALTKVQDEVWKVEHLSLPARTEFKLRADGDWGKSFGLYDDLLIGAQMPVYRNGGNFVAPVGGVYDITLDAAAETVLVELVPPAFQSYDNFTEPSSWTVIGALSADAISWDNDIVMTSNGEWSVAQGVVLTTDDQFKFRQNQDWAVNYGGNWDLAVPDGWMYVLDPSTVVTGFADGPNLAMAESGTYDILFHNEGHLFVAVPTLGGTHTLAHDPQDPQDPPTPPEPFDGWSVIGNICNTSWDTDFDMTTEDQVVFTSSLLAINEGEVFKIRYGHDWEVNRGPDSSDPVTIGVPFDVVGNGQNITLTESGTYIIIYDSQAEQITVVSSQPAAPSWGVVGSMTGWGSDPDIPMVEDPNIPGLFVADNVSLSAEDVFKIRANSSWDVNYGGTFQDFGYTFAAYQNGENIAVGKSGVYSILLDLTNPNSPLIAVLEAPSSAPSITIDGDFDDWANVQGVQGSDGILVMKSHVTDTDLFFYFEFDSQYLVLDNVNFANYLTLCFDCGGDRTKNVSYWGIVDGGVNYDFHYQLWLMQGGQVKMANWDVTGLAYNGAFEGGVMKLEFSFARSSNTLFQNPEKYFGAYLNDNYVTYLNDQEVWDGGNLTGLAPAQGNNLVELK